MQMAKLGKGLSALIEEEYQSEDTSYSSISGTEMKLVSIASLVAGKYQPRLSFDDEALAELANSVAKNGIMQPILVRPSDQGEPAYEIIAGERRWRAAKLAGLDEIPVIIRQLTNQEALELALIENIQRSDLSPLEEAEGFQRLIDEFSYTQEALAEKVGKSRSHVANLLRLRHLPPEIKVFLDKGELSMGHARALMNAEKNVFLAQQVVQRGLSVRQTERLVKDLQSGGEPSIASPAASKPSRSAPRRNLAGQAEQGKTEDILALEHALTESVGLRVEISDFGEQQGQVTLHYGSLEELDTILRRLDADF